MGCGRGLHAVGMKNLKGVESWKRGIQLFTIRFSIIVAGHG